MRKIVYTVMVCVLVICSSNNDASANNSRETLPGELIPIAKKHKCEQVHDFYKNRPGKVNPPYVYGYLPGNKEDSAVFWCKLSNDNWNGKLILYSKKEIPEKYNCPEIIDSNDTPRGLTIYRGEYVELKHFIYMKDYKKDVPDILLDKMVGILSSYDGVESLYYCYKGDWLVRERH
ncbi:MAG: hypothetical protein KAR83_02770 [Thermodesulfovibrionales bacterium]|nr:hypothetical protein [Thermodesulfovibrionales bacterium]